MSPIFRRLLIFYVVMSLVVITLGVLWGMPLRKIVFYPLVGGFWVLASRTAVFRRYVTSVPGDDLTKVTVLIVATLILYELIR